MIMAAEREKGISDRSCFPPEKAGIQKKPTAFREKETKMSIPRAIFPQFCLFSPAFVQGTIKGKRFFPRICKLMLHNDRGEKAFLYRVAS